MERMEKENKKSEWKQQYQKRKGYFKEYYQKHKDVMDANHKKNAKKYREEYKHLKEENKKLRDYVDNLDSENDNQAIEIEELREENKKLKKYYDRDKEELMESCYGLARENDELKKECEENDYLVEDNARWMKKCEEKTMEIKKLKSDLSECECSFGFENDEVGFWKREYKRLKKWIKDHCKGYGNLFPEDEMKRQWKKADKKRK